MRGAGEAETDLSVRRHEDTQEHVDEDEEDEDGEQYEERLTQPTATKPVVFNSSSIYFKTHNIKKQAIQIISHMVRMKYN